jgi:glutathione S-transferase
MIELYATMASINGYKARMLMAILNVPFELIELDMYGGEHKREPFLSLNPFGQMPALRDGDYEIADSHACLVYLARKYGTEDWLPSDSEGEAKVAEWLSKSANEIHQGPWMARAKLRRPDAITISDEEIHARCDHVLSIMDTHLAKTDWLALGHPTFADLSCFAAISMLTESGYDTSKWQALTRWIERVKSIPGNVDMDGEPFK